MKTETIRCRNCGNQIGCEKDEIGLVVICPICGKETIAMTKDQELRIKRNATVNARMIGEREENEKLCFWLGFLLNLAGVFISMSLGGQRCVKAALKGFAINMGAGFVVGVLLLLFATIAGMH